MLDHFPRLQGVVRTLLGSSVIIGLLLSAIRSDAAPVEPASGGQTANGLSIKIDENRSPLVAGTSFSVSATLSNNSKSTIYIYEQYLRLKVAQEIEGSESSLSSFWYGFLPAADHDEAEGSNRAILALKPSEQTAVWWSWSRASYGSCTTTLCNIYKDIFDYLLFEPGTYRLTVTANYWDNAAQVGKGIADLALETKTLNVTVPQSIILIGAAIGGLIAYLVIPKLRRHPNPAHRTPRGLLVVVGAALTMLFSATITILMARISESQFPIRVAVSDFWGAIAIGFIAAYLGVETLNKIAGSRKQAETSDGREH